MGDNFILKKRDSLGAPRADIGYEEELFDPATRYAVETSMSLIILLYIALRNYFFLKYWLKFDL